MVKCSMNQTYLQERIQSKTVYKKSFNLLLFSVTLKKLAAASPVAEFPLNNTNAKTNIKGASLGGANHLLNGYVNNLNVAA